LLRARTEALIDATEPLQQKLIDATVMPEASLKLFNGPTIGPYHRFRPAMQSIEIARHTVRDVGAGLANEGHGITRVSLLTMLEEPAIGRSIPSQWRLHWRRDEGRWRVSQIELVKWQGRPATEAGEDAMRSWLQRGG